MLELLKGANYDWKGFEVLTAVSMKMAVFWVVAPCSHRPDVGSCKDLCNVGKLLPDYTALQPRRQPSTTGKFVIVIAPVNVSAHDLDLQICFLLSS
jgi:hypothetical protein